LPPETVKGGQFQPQALLPSWRLHRRPRRQFQFQKLLSSWQVHRRPRCRRRQHLQLPDRDGDVQACSLQLTLR